MKKGLDICHTLCDYRDMSQSVKDRPKDGRVGVRLTPQVFDWVSREAREHDWSMSKTVAKIVSRAFEREHAAELEAAGSKR